MAMEASSATGAAQDSRLVRDCVAAKRHWYSMAAQLSAPLINKLSKARVSYNTQEEELEVCGPLLLSFPPHHAASPRISQLCSACKRVYGVDVHLLMEPSRRDASYHSVYCAHLRT